jgi:hypothetical protein
MKNVIQIVLRCCGVVLLAFALFALFTLAKSNPELSVTYLTQTNNIGHYVAFFAITNVGNVPVISYSTGSIELFGQSKKERVGCEPSYHPLQPGDSDIVQVPLPTTIVEHWRFTIFYSHEGRRYYSQSSSEWINGTNCTSPTSPK